MVTIATDALCRHIVADCPIRPAAWYEEGNFSGDKKASGLGMITGRGRKVSASVVLPGEVVTRLPGTSIDAMLDYARVANLGSLLSGQLGAQAHYANGLAAIYVTTGQDAVCVAESAVGFTRMERREAGLFCSVTMPSILVGTAGGGTDAPTQSACLDLMGLKGEGHGPALAEVTAAACLCGDISIVAAMASGAFSGAHEKLARLRCPRFSVSGPISGSGSRFSRRCRCWRSFRRPASMSRRCWRDARCRGRGPMPQVSSRC